MRCCTVVVRLAIKVLEEDPAKARVLRVHHDIVVNGEPSGPIIDICTVHKRVRNGTGQQCAAFSKIVL